MTPTMANAVLHFIKPFSRNEASPSCLSDEERARAARFVFEKDATRWAHYRAGLRQILGATLGIDANEVPRIEGQGGKPALAEPFANLEFNLSHADDLAAVIISKNGPVGIDLEPWSRAPTLIECVDFFCHPAEQEQLPNPPGDRATRLLEIWTSKEALLKAVGTGLSYPPPKLQVIGDRGEADTLRDGLDRFRLLTPDHPQQKTHRLAIAVTEEIDRIDYSEPPNPA